MRDVGLLQKFHQMMFDHDQSSLMNLLLFVVDIGLAPLLIMLTMILVGDIGSGLTGQILITVLMDPQPYTVLHRGAGLNQIIMVAMKIAHTSPANTIIYGMMCDAEKTTFQFAKACTLLTCLLIVTKSAL